ncbi:aldehyde dehydrogenase [Nocardioides sp. cx-173]|uniref:aldehyde dehydrogenase n=1 Tax=Nocardioides sp. cx-173 TaxID=2898796 RepID=UPI001E2D9597|nr:aldehyde dehydrogenase [Nocardioides sp. cx-173]MCD4526606.1 aldehyde dehydrogenase [Nocardioides sp. cx-173]UGB40701.1 aldehyde dehydrogenase [Nocardioides sp. cx-173]
MEHIPGVYIDGQARDGLAGDFQVQNPATEEYFATVSLANGADVDDAVRSARLAHESGVWRDTPLAERQKVVLRIAELIEERAPELARLRTLSIGAPYAEHLSMSAPLTRMYVESVEKVVFEQVRRDSLGDALVMRKPIGVVAGVVPWNVPVRNELKKLIPALLCGNTIVLKPALESPLTGAALMRIFTDAGLPPGVANLVVGGPETGEALVAHPDVRKIAFTGSTATGARIAAVAGPQFKRLQLELGGKSAAIVCDDVDLADVIPPLLGFGFANSGQICASLSRIVVPRRLQDAIVEALAEGARRHVLGDPMDPATTMGPVVSERQRDKVLGLIESGRQQGARLAAGGGVPAGLDRGWFVEPTVFADVTSDMRIAQEEIFGPVLSVLPYDTEDEAVAIANNSEYGLHGAVHSKDPEHALELAKRIDTGTAAVNSFDVPLSAPFGGVKSSGVGRENGVEGFDHYLEWHSYKLTPTLADTLQQRGL